MSGLNRNVLSLRSGGWEPGIRASAGCFPPGTEGGSVQASPSGGLRPFLLNDSILPVSLHPLSPVRAGRSVQMAALYKDTDPIG